MERFIKVKKQQLKIKELWHILNVVSRTPELRNVEVTTMQKCLHWQNVQTAVLTMSITVYALLVVITEVSSLLKQK